MSTSLPTGRRGQILALGLTATLLLSLWFGVAAPIIGWHDSRATAIEQRRSVGRRMADLVDRLPELQAKARAPNGHALPANAILGGQNDAIAGAALQDLLQKMAAAVKASIISEETLPAEQVGAYRKIGVRATLSAAPWPVVVQLLAAIERSRPVMLVDDLQLRGAPLLQINPMLVRNPGMPPGFNGPPPEAKAPSGPPPIDATFTVLAFRAGSQEGEAAGAPPPPRNE